MSKQTAKTTAKPSIVAISNHSEQEKTVTIPNNTNNFAEFFKILDQQSGISKNLSHATIVSIGNFFEAASARINLAGIALEQSSNLVHKIETNNHKAMKDLSQIASIVAENNSALVNFAADFLDLYGKMVGRNLQNQAELFSYVINKK